MGQASWPKYSRKGIGVYTPTKCIIWNLASVQLEIVLVSVQDSCMVCAQCTIGSEIVVEVPDGTPR